MTYKIEVVFLNLVRLMVVWMFDTASLFILSHVASGVTIQANTTTQVWVVAAAAALVLGLVNFIIRPIILLLALPFGFIVILLSGFLVNGAMLMITSNLLPEFLIRNWGWAFLGGFLFSLINTILTDLITLDDQGSYYENMVERWAKKWQVFSDSTGPGQGIVMLEIDGLSYHHFQKALERGYMPTLASLMREQGYNLHRVETGIPSMTSSCQAGILYGDNYDIPSFRWFDRDLNRFIVSQVDAAMLDQRYSKGQGLVRGGSSIGNMLNGDAHKSMFVIAKMKSSSKEEARQRARDIYLMMFNPYFFVRTIVIFFGDVLLEIGEYFLQVLKNVRPRLNRLYKGYPLMRAALTSFLKDVSAYLITLDIIRGTPALYHTYAGYDEMAHHAGPWTKDAFHELRRFDRIVARLMRVMAEKAPRPYELILLSDHGQSFGSTFRQRYDITLHDFIQQNIPQIARVESKAGSDDGSTGIMSIMNELENVQEQGVGNPTSWVALRQANTLLKTGIEKRLDMASEKPAEVKVAFSGNLANVYFTDLDHRVKISELNSTYPHLLKAMVNHEGIGFVVGYNDLGEPICLGKNGSRNLCKGDIVGEDPLAPYADGKTTTIELRAEQVRRLADFPHTGDLIVNSPVYPDGTVAAYEELIGSHGGMGGEQTDAFILAPGDMKIPETHNSIDVFAILNARRGLVPQPKPVDLVKTLDPWNFANLSLGLIRVRTWLSRATRIMVFERDAYREVVQDATMTSPALLIALLGASLPTLVFQENQIGFLARIGMWLLCTLITWLAGRALKSKEEFTPLLRAFGFAQVSSLWLLLSLVPQIAPLSRLIYLLVFILTAWIGAAMALKLKGWKTDVLPFASVVLYVLGVWGLHVLFLGAELTLKSLLSAFGVW